MALRGVKGQGPLPSETSVRRRKNLRAPFAESPIPPKQLNQPAKEPPVPLPHTPKRNPNTAASSHPPGAAFYVDNPGRLSYNKQVQTNRRDTHEAPDH